MALFSAYSDSAVFFSRTDPEHLFASYSVHPFDLDGFTWSTVEHYFQALKSQDQQQQGKIAEAKTAKQARRLGRSRRRKLREDWSKVKLTVMTRAVYTQARTHDVISEAILATGDADLVNNSQYDYFWGCGRDRRGDNHYGKVLMQVREKLRSEAHQD